MIHGTLQWASMAMHGEFHAKDVEFSGVSTDTREIRKGELFFCLIGQRDGHEFAKEALDKGAAGVVMDEKHRGHLEGGPLIVVQNTLRALGDLAQTWRRKFSIPLIAIAGSNGKTTTKELTRSIVSTAGKVLATEGNLNNLIGVPKTLFRLSAEHQFAIIEVGMNDFGELARLTEITEPCAGLITNIGYEHLEKLKDLEGVARAEGELFAGLSSEATALINLSDERIARLPTPAKKLFYGTPETPVWGKVLKARGEGERPLHLEVHVGHETQALALKIPGPHNLQNVLAALVVGYSLGIPLQNAKQAIEAFTPAHSRMELLTLRGGRRLIDDCYNANPSSTFVALQTLAHLKGRSPGLAILGEMLELGAYTVEGHRQVGRKAAEEKIDYLIAIGDHAPEVLQAAKASGMPQEKLKAFGNTEEALQGLRDLPGNIQWILVKGSRGNRLEKIVNYIKENF